MLVFYMTTLRRTGFLCCEIEKMILHKETMNSADGSLFGLYIRKLFSYLDSYLVYLVT